MTPSVKNNAASKAVEVLHIEWNGGLAGAVKIS